MFVILSVLQVKHYCTHDHNIIMKVYKYFAAKLWAVEHMLA